MSPMQSTNNNNNKKKKKNRNKKKGFNNTSKKEKQLGHQHQQQQHQQYNSIDRSSHNCYYSSDYPTTQAALPGSASSSSRCSRNIDQSDNPVSNPNFVPEAGPGCHIVRFPFTATTTSSSGTTTSTSSHDDEDPPHILGWDTDIDPQEDFLEGQVIPDLAIDPDENTLTVCNVSDSTRVAYISIYEAECTGQNDKAFSSGITVDDEGISHSCVTFIVLCPPMTFCTLCQIHPPSSAGGDITNVRIESDVQEWKRHPDPTLKCPFLIRGFPLLGGPFLCTQGVGGHLTHYFSGNLHAIDFRCEVGTPLLAVEDGVVVEVRVGTTLLSGIGVTNLFEWNSIMIRHNGTSPRSSHDVDADAYVDDCEDEHHPKEDGHDDSSCQDDDIICQDLDNQQVFYTEYVHIQSSKAKVGDRVKRGDEIGYSGSVGFSPEPHLHFAVYQSGEADAVTVGFSFVAENGIVYEPKAGMFYNASSGPVVAS